MPIRLPLPAAMRLWALVLLAAIGLQAAVPMAMPLETRHGSAFSAATVEVALAPQRRSEAIRQIALPQPATPPEPAAAVAILTEAPRLPLARPDSTGPPAWDILKRQPAPRGPPPA